ACRGDERVDDIGIAQIEARLALEEMMEIVLPAPRLPAPGRAAEHREPVVGRRAVGPGVTPDIPVLARIGARRAAFAEPDMLGRSVAADEVDQHLEAERMGARQEAVEILDRAEDGIDGAMIGDVVAEIAHRREEEWREPDGVDAERRHVIQFLGDAGEIADAVAIAVEKTARIDLVDDGAGPPFVILHAEIGPVCSGLWPWCFILDIRYRSKILVKR